MVFHCKLSEVMYYAFFLLMFTTRILGLYEGNVVYSLVLIISMLCFMSCYVMTPGTLVSFLADAVLMILAFVAWRFSGEKGLILFFSMMIGIRRISLDRLFRLTLAISGSAYAIMIMLGAFGIIEECQNSMGYRPILGYINRRTISPLQLNIVMEPYLVLMVLVLYLIRDKGKKQTLIVSGLLLVGLSYLFGYCVTISSFFVGIVLILVYWYFKNYCNYSVITSFALQVVYALIVIIGVVGSYIDDSEYGTGLTISRRHQIGHYYLQYNVPTLFGQRLYNPKPAFMKYGIHQSQLYLLLQYGIILFVVVNILHHIAICSMVKWRSAAALSATFSFAALGVVEPLLFNLSFKNIVFVFVGKAYGEVLDRIAARHISWGKSICMIPDKEFSFTIQRREGMKTKVAKHISRRKSAMIAVVMGLIVAGIVAICIPETTFIYDQVDECSVYYTPVYDHIRLIFSAFMWAAIWTFVLLSLLTRTGDYRYHIGNNDA